jgi:hypothetical protein
MIKGKFSKTYEVEVGCIIHTIRANSQDHALQQICERENVKPNNVRSVKEWA